MTTLTMQQALDQVVDMLRDVFGDDWDEGIELNAETSLLYDLELESIEVLGFISQLNERWPDSGALAALIERGLGAASELTLGELAQWLAANAVSATKSR